MALNTTTRRNLLLANGDTEETDQNSLVRIIFNKLFIFVILYYKYKTKILIW